jgi:predicted enzyme related to lactoylglutathione lyase
MSVCHDPSGAEYDLFQPGQLEGTDVDSDATGAPTWFEALTTDVARAVSFYSALFQWRVAPGDGPRILTNALGPFGSISGLRSPASGGVVASQWLTYFATPDLEAVVRIALSLGAEVLTAPSIDAAGHRIIKLRSPQGVMFGALQRGSAGARA